MSATQTWILRSSVVLGMVVAVVTVLYFTPMPEHHFKSCDRSCHELDWPMICRIKLNLEVYHTLGKSCGDCPQNETHCFNKHCIVADGHRRALLTANRALPGPNIRVCQNDIVVVDVANKVPGQEFSIHWRGQHMQATPCMDGVPMVTQCPISSFTTFQYKFRASAPGTHLWHAHSNSHLADGIFGAFIVRQPDLVEPQKRLYDVDTKDHVLVITEWNRRSPFVKAETEASLLVNGRNNAYGYIPKFTVKKGLRYRFRMAYAAGANGCPVELTIERHRLKVISLDGNPTVPYEVTSIVIGRGERLDFVLKANQDSDDYLLTIQSKCENKAEGIIASLVYEDHEERRNKIGKEIDDDTDAKMTYRQEENNNEISEKNSDNSRVFHTEVCEGELGKVCINDAQSLFVMPSSLRSEKVDHKLYLMFDHLVLEKYDLDKPVTRIPRVNNITFTFPSSPLLTQYDDVVPSTICNQDNIPEQCDEHDVCECVHVEQVPLDSSVEIILVSKGGEEDNVFHMHGHSFYVIGSRQFSETVSLDEIKDLDENGLLFKRNLKSPAHKDTIRIPKYGAVAIRFYANNPGFWMLRDEDANHWTRGLDVVLQVGTRRDFQTTPSNFPRCGNWIGPEFFLA